MSARQMLGVIFCVLAPLAALAQPASPAAAAEAEGYSPARLLNQGNAYFRPGQYPQARVCYERALLLRPGFAAARTNLRLALEKLGQQEPQPAWWQRPFFQASANQWSLAAGAAALFLTAAALHWCWHGRLPRWLRWLSLAAACALAVAAAGIVQQLPKFHQGIALASGAAMRLSPFAQAQSVGTLPAGAAARVRELYRGWYLVEDARGQKGWVAANQFEPLVPELVKE